LNKKKADSIISSEHSKPKSLRMKTTPQLTLSQAIEGYFLSNASRRLSAHTLKDYTNTYRLFCDFIGSNTRFDKITKNKSGPSWAVIARP